MREPHLPPRDPGAHAWLRPRGAPLHACCPACRVRLPGDASAATTCPCCGERTVAVTAFDAIGCRLWAPPSEAIDALVHALQATRHPWDGDGHG